MKKRKNSGFTLIEMIAVIIIVVLLVVGIGTGINAAVRAYRTSVFESYCAMLADILDGTIGDALRYSENIEYLSDTDFTFTSYDYGVRNAKFVIVDADGNPADEGYVAMLGDTRTGRRAVLIINGGAYAEILRVRNLVVRAHPVNTTTQTAGDPAEGGYYFDVSYTIFSTEDPDLNEDYGLCIRQANADISIDIGSEASHSDDEESS